MLSVLQPEVSLRLCALRLELSTYISVARAFVSLRGRQEVSSTVPPVVLGLY